MRTPLAVAALATVALLTACGSGATSTAATSATASALSASASGGPENEPAAAIVATAEKALASATTVHVAGAATANGETTRIDLRLKRDAGAVGTVAANTGSVSLVRVGQVAYIKGDTQFYTSVAGGQAAKLLAGKWIKVNSSSSGFASILEFTDLATFAKQVTKPTGTVKKGAVRSVAGVRGIEVTDSDGVLVVALEGPAYPLFVGPAKGSTGQGFTFSDYNQPVTLTPPPADQVVDVPIP